MSVIQRSEKWSHLNKENRVIYDRKRLEAISISEVIEEHPEWPKAKQEMVGKSDERIESLIQRRLVVDLYERMIENDNGNSDEEFNFQMAKWIVEHSPAELIPNLNEWIENRVLSDIKIHGVSIKDVMTQFGKARPIPFIEAMECFAYWKSTNYAHKHFCKIFFLDK